MINFRQINMAIMVLLAVFFLTACNDSSQQPQQVQQGSLVGKVAPALTLTDMQGRQVSLEQFHGKVVILNFWATWCPPCREEMPSMEKLYQDYKEQGLVLLAVNIEENGKQAVSTFLQKRPYSFPILLDSDNVAQNTFGVFRFPESFIIDRNGVIVEKIVGGRNWLSGPTFKLIDFLLNG